MSARKDQSVYVVMRHVEYEDGLDTNTVAAFSTLEKATDFLNTVDNLRLDVLNSEHSRLSDSFTKLIHAWSALDQRAAFGMARETFYTIEMLALDC